MKKKMWDKQVNKKVNIKKKMMNLKVGVKKTVVSHLKMILIARMKLMIYKIIIQIHKDLLIVNRKVIRNLFPKAILKHSLNLQKILKIPIDSKQMILRSPMIILIILKEKEEIIL